MKNYYKINEISKLYGIGPDSLRYYERLGILKPHRDTNNYRLYSLKDLYKLNIIRDLRSLDFSMAQIKEYLDEQSIDNTLELLHKEQELLRTRMEELQTRQKIIETRIASLHNLRNISEQQVFTEFISKRFCVQVNEYITRDEEMDFLIKKLQKKHEDKIHNLGTQTIGAFLSVPELKKEISNVYTSVFFILKNEPEEYDFILPEGNYLSFYYRGNYDYNATYTKKLLDYAAEHSLSPSGSPFEIYEIDNRDTLRPEEFLTKIQIAL